ncbi:NADH-quinone oxidoreductase subunit NuoH [Desulfosarcina sp.]|uniref:NADH-quinone oxidoreductase subunit NuoH n=1 Tax=Desulfosarcina sp. TaxID=2027861 RepID=UPI0029B1B1C5|nr:NADH-quinone oxidoreductase subunit NuoH [Desulfosarcina sp.]MDX2453993.1 NADH-quinone oxidoreductase subunit NuoH [Desulfosarcina sp.]MDX2491687.1 NADH-quinone oxidoreductase subunit NuoH [Desulfosarcina sp.]
MDYLLGLIILLIKIAVMLGGLLLAASYLVWLERKLLARLQIRLGPNRAGIFGLLQPIADAIKLLTKEDIVPSAADGFIFRLAPAVVAVTALLMFAVVPLGPDMQVFGHSVPMVITDLNVGLLFVFALSSLGVYGVALGGWASNSKFALLGGIRGAAQMISYELALGLSLVPVVMLAGSLSLTAIVDAQAGLPFIVLQPVSFAIFVISAMAESKRIPFDLPEAENELGAGFHTEYSGMRFGLFFLGEYVHIQVLGALTAVFFLGGWHGPLLPPVVWLMLKILIVAVIMIWIRGTLPRLRYDQLMALGWKVLIPASLINIVVTGAFIQFAG